MCRRGDMHANRIGKWNGLPSFTACRAIFFVHGNVDRHKKRHQKVPVLNQLAAQMTLRRRGVAGFRWPADLRWRHRPGWLYRPAAGLEALPLPRGRLFACAEGRNNEQKKGTRRCRSCQLAAQMTLRRRGVAGFRWPADLRWRHRPGWLSLPAAGLEALPLPRGRLFACAEGRNNEQKKRHPKVPFLSASSADDASSPWCCRVSMASRSSVASPARVALSASSGA